MKGFIRIILGVRIFGYNRKGNWSKQTLNQSAQDRMKLKCIPAKFPSAVSQRQRKNWPLKVGFTRGIHWAWLAQGLLSQVNGDGSEPAAESSMRRSHRGPTQPASQMHWSATQRPWEPQSIPKQTTRDSQKSPRAQTIPHSASGGVYLNQFDKWYEVVTKHNKNDNLHKLKNLDLLTAQILWFV